MARGAQGGHGPPVDRRVKKIIIKGKKGEKEKEKTGKEKKGKERKKKGIRKEKERQIFSLRQIQKEKKKTKEKE